MPIPFKNYKNYTQAKNWEWKSSKVLKKMIKISTKTRLLTINLSTQLASALISAKPLKYQIYQIKAIIKYQNTSMEAL